MFFKIKKRNSFPPYKKHVYIRFRGEKRQTLIKLMTYGASHNVIATDYMQKCLKSTTVLYKKTLG